MQQVKAVFASGEFTFFANKVGKFMQNHTCANFSKFIYGLFCKSIKFVGKFLIKMARETKF